MEQKLNYDTFFVSNFFIKTFSRPLRAFLCRHWSFWKRIINRFTRKMWEMFVSNFVAIKINFWHRKIYADCIKTNSLFIGVPGVKRIILWKIGVITILFFLALIIHTHSSNQRYRCGNFLRHVHQHKTSKDGHNHFVFSLSQVLRQSIDRCSDSASHWDGIFCIAHGLLK